MQFEFASCPASWAMLEEIFIVRAQIPPIGMGIFDGPRNDYVSGLFMTHFLGPGKSGGLS